MKIERRTKDRRDDTELRADLARVSATTEHPGRACGPGCKAVCPTCPSTICNCNCSRDRPDIPVKMTTDANFPIESSVAPLVYELKRMGIFEPCWSCEGHNDQNGKLWKIPRVWFYCASAVKVRVLSDVLKNLKIKERITAPWQVSLTYSEEDNPAARFSLEPVIGPDSLFTLDDLRHDIKVISEFLHSGMLETAGRLAARGRA